MNQHAIDPCQRSFSSYVTVRSYTQTHIHDQVLYLDPQVSADAGGLAPNGTSRCIQRWTLSVINRRRSSVNHTWLCPQSPGAGNQVQSLGEKSGIELALFLDIRELRLWNRQNIGGVSKTSWIRCAVLTQLVSLTDCKVDRTESFMQAVSWAAV